jgi:hypothetical protein
MALILNIMTRAILLCIFLITGLWSYGQSKEDIISVIKVASGLSELDPLFQVDLSEGPTLVLTKRDRLTGGSNEVERNYWSLSNDDFWGSPRPIRIFTEQEADQEGVRRDKMVSIVLSFSGDQCNIRFSAAIEEGTRYCQGWVSLIRSGFDWEITGKSVQTR